MASQDLSSPEGMSGPAWGVVKSWFLGRVLRRELSDEVTCEHRPKWNKELSSVEIYGKSLPVSRNSKCRLWNGDSDLVRRPVAEHAGALRAMVRTWVSML